LCINTEKNGLIWAKIVAKKSAEDTKLPPKVQEQEKRRNYSIVKMPNDPCQIIHVVSVQIIFFVIGDQTIQSGEKRFKRLQETYYSDNFGFSHCIGKSKTAENEDLLKRCKHLQTVSTDNDLKDVDGIDPFPEPIISRSLLDEYTNPLQTLNILKITTSHGSFPSLTVALRIMPAILVTLAEANRNPFTQ